MPAVLVVLQFRCALDGCGATWRILPAFLARHLWHAWKVVEQVVRPAPAMAMATTTTTTTTRPRIAATTRGRWLARLSSSARVLVAVLAISAGVVLEEVAQRVGLMGTRGELVRVYVAMTARVSGYRRSPRWYIDSNEAFVSCRTRAAPRDVEAAGRARTIPSFVAIAVREDGAMDDEQRRKVALFRFAVLGAVVSARLEHGDRAEMFTAAAKRDYVTPEGRVVRISARTIEIGTTPTLAVGSRR